jgi:hypothetical protein
MNGGLGEGQLGCGEGSLVGADATRFLALLEGVAVAVAARGAAAAPEAAQLVHVAVARGATRKAAPASVGATRTARVLAGKGLLGGGLAGIVNQEIVVALLGPLRQETGSAESVAEVDGCCVL